MTGHDALNIAIRAQAGRIAIQEQAEKPVGDIGIGRGGGALPRERLEPVSMSSLIRAERDMRREERLGRAREYDARG